MMIYSKWLRTLFVIVLSGLFFSNNIFAQDVTDSTTTNITTTTPTTNKDPLERFNRAMFQFNDFLDRYILKPVANLYIQIVPKPLSKGLSNIYNNIDTVPTVLNDLLQFNFYQATSDVWRLAFNSTIGILGFFDVAKELGLEPNYEDFGLTLARWGYTNSTYIVIPFLGPSTIRDTLGFPVNYYYLSIYPYVDPIQARYALYFTGVVVRRADILRYDSLMQQLSFDKYIFMRDAYLQHRNYLIERNDQLSNPYIAKYQLEKEEAETSQQDVKSNIETKPFADV